MSKYDCNKFLIETMIVVIKEIKEVITVHEATNYKTHLIVSSLEKLNDIIVKALRDINHNQIEDLQNQPSVYDIGRDR
jgi:alpha-D-ribose 1-methylphosphonate 5-triphosphate synthase subunit PhnI